MSSEFKTTVKVAGTTYDGAPFTHSYADKAFDQDSTRKDAIKTVQECTTSFSALSWGDVGASNVPCVALTNTSTTVGNNLKVSFDNGTTTHLLVPPGQSVLLWMNAYTSMTSYLKIAFATASAAAEVTIIESAM